MVVELERDRSCPIWQVAVSGHEQSGQNVPKSNTMEATPTGSGI